MKSKLLPLYLAGVLASGVAEPQEPSSFSAIAERAAYTMRVPGYPDFLVADEDAVGPQTGAGLRSGDMIVPSQ